MSMTTNTPPTAIVTGGSRGFGRAVVTDLVQSGWTVVTDGRDAEALRAAHPDQSAVVAVPGDVTDPAHRRALVEAASRTGRIDLLVNNAGALGPSPLPHVKDLTADALREVLDANVVAPAALITEALPLLRSSGGAIVNITSDASVEAYEGWGAYGASKAALDHLSAIVAAEEPDTAVWALDPGDMRTDMHQAAFPGEDISDRPLPEISAPAVRALAERRPPSGRVRAAELLEVVST